MFKVKGFTILIAFILLSAACGGRSTLLPTKIPITIPTLPPVTVADLSDTWTGTLDDQGNGTTYNMVLTLTQAADNTVSGEVNFTTSAINETVSITGVFDGTTLHFQESTDRFFTATLSGDTLTGYVNFNVYDEPGNAWAQISLTRATAGGDGTIATPPPVSGDPVGTWIGNMTAIDGHNYFTVLIIQVVDTSLAGYFSWVEPTYGEYNPMQGSLDGATLHLQTEQAGPAITATLAGDTISGYAANNCLDCPEEAFGQFNLQRTASTLPTLNPSFAPLDMAGTWTGKIIYSNERDGLWDMSLAVTQPAGDPVINGQVILTQAALNNRVTKTIYGQALGTGLFFDEATQVAGTQRFWGSVNGNRIDGYMGETYTDRPEHIGAIFSLVHQ